MEITQIRKSYDRAAGWYDLGEGVPELLGLRRLRRKLMRRASGKVLDVAAGTGKNLPLLPQGIEWTGIDVSERMLQRARRRARPRGASARVVVMDAQVLAFRDDTFDTVVSTLSSCTFPDPVAALREMGRVCRAHGKILLLEHGRSHRPRIARFQDRHADRHARALGCYWNRDPGVFVRDAGLHVQRIKSYFFGIFTVIEAAPAAR